MAQVRNMLPLLWGWRARRGRVAALTFRRREYLLSAPSERFLADLKRQETELKACVPTKSVDWDAAIDHTIAAEALAADG